MIPSKYVVMDALYFNFKRYNSSLKEFDQFSKGCIDRELNKVGNNINLLIICI